VGVASVLAYGVYALDKHFMQDENEEKFSYTRFPHNRFWINSKW